MRRPYCHALALFALTSLAAVPAVASSFEDINMNPSINIDGSGNVVVNWVGGSFDEYHVGWRVNNGPRGARTRSGDKHFTVLMKYNPGSTYQVEVQGCVKHSLRHDECTTWDSISCGGAQSVCPGSPEAMRRPRRYTY